MSKKELENKNDFNSPKGESFHDSQTESDSININQKSSNKENAAIKDNNNDINDIINIENNLKEEPTENNDHISYDKKFWNINDQQYNDLNLRKEPTNESKTSLDTPDISKQKLKEYLNEDLLNALEVSPMVTPKNNLKDAATENLNDINNNENIIPISDDMMNGSNNDLFQFSLYNNNNSGNAKNEKENNINNKENNTLKNNPIDELIKISENNEEKNKNQNQKEEDDFNDNGIMDSFIPTNSNLNNMQSIGENTNDFNNNINININYIKNKDEIRNIKDDEGGGNKKNVITRENINQENKNTFSNINNNTNTNINNTINNNTNNNTNTNTSNNLNNNNNINYNKFNQNIENKAELGEGRKVNTSKNYIPSHMQHPYIAHMPFPYQAQQHIIQALQPNIHENKFDGNKKFNLIIPIQTMKKNPKMKKPFEIREGDWTCSDCGNLNFSFRVKCNRCGILKEVSEEKKLNNNNEQDQKNNNIKDNNNNTNNNNNNNSKNYYSNMNMMQYKGVIFQSPLYNNGEPYYPKYYSGYIYVPVQGQYIKNPPDKKTAKEENKNKQINKDKDNISNNDKNNNDIQKENDKKEEDKKDNNSENPKKTK